MMNMKSFTSAALAVVLSVSVMSVPAMAAPQVRSNSDIGISYVKHTGSNAVTGQSTLYHGQAYTATLEQMAAKLAQGGEVARPKTVTIQAASLADAEQQIAQALQYAPEHIAIEFTQQADADAFYSRYRDWEHGTQDIDLWVGAIQTEDASPLTVTKSGKTVDCALVYAEGWLAYVDTQGLRVFKDEDWSDALADWAKTYLDPIKAQGLSEAEQFAEIARILKATTDYDHKSPTYTKGSDDFLTVHSMYGPITDGRGVCDGYSYTVQFAASYLGLKAFEVYGPGHAWNKVCVDGEWYVLDMANIDNDVWMARNWFLISDQLACELDDDADWFRTLYPCDEIHPQRDALAARL